MSYVYIAGCAPDFDVYEAAEKVSKYFRLVPILGVTKKVSIGTHQGIVFNTKCQDAAQKIRIAVLQNAFDFDVMVLDELPNPNKKGELILDMDMTSVQIEGIDEIARRLGVYDDVAAITSKAMHGGLDFASSLRKRVSLLKGGDAKVIEQVKEIMTETPGLEALMNITAEYRWHRGICSGGFVQLICVLEQKYKLEMVCANSLEIKGGLLTGKVDKAIVDAEAKRQGVLSLAHKYNIKRPQIIVLGDGANDLKMIGEAGVGIAYHAKPLVREKAPCCINHCDLTAVAILLQACENL